MAGDRGGKRTAAKRRTEGGREVQNNKETEQVMMRELAEFVFMFGEKYDVLLNVKLKPRKMKQNRGGVL